MASLRIEGAIDRLRDKQIQFIRDVLSKRGFKDNKVIFEPVGKSGDNYGSNVLRITTIVEGGKDFKMIAKIAPDHEAMRKGANTAILFTNEIVMYEEVLPKLVSLQIAADVPRKDLFRYAECYGCLREEPNEVILLEDLNEANFGLLDRFSSLSNDAVRLILKNFALIHSLSYVLKEKEPATYKKLSSKLNDIWNNTSQEFQLYREKIEQEAIAIVDENYKNLLRGAVSSSPLTIGENLKRSEKHSKHLVIQQGDGWTNNIMFKLVDNIPTECIMIDYQGSKEANPMCDFLYMVLNCTDHDARTKYYFEWIDYYHDELDKSLSEFGLKAKLIYPRDQLDADLRRYSKMFFRLALMIYNVMSMSHEEAAVIKGNMKQEEFNINSIEGLSNLSLDTIRLYKSRVEGLVDSFRLFGYL